MGAVKNHFFDEINAAPEPVFGPFSDPLVEAEAAIEWLEQDATARPGEYEPVLCRLTALRMRLMNLHDHVNRTVATARLDAISRLTAHMQESTQ